MDMNFEQKVREKAYEMWEAAGMMDGMAHQHWTAAEQVVMHEAQMPKAKKIAKAAVAKKAAPKAVATRKPAAKSPAKAAKTIKH